MIRINMGLFKNHFVVLGLVAAGLLFLALSSGSSETSLLSERMVDWKSVNLEDEEVTPLAKNLLNQIKNDQIVEKSARVEVKHTILHTYLVCIEYETILSFKI